MCKTEIVMHRIIGFRPCFELKMVFDIFIMMAVRESVGATISWIPVRQSSGVAGPPNEVVVPRFAGGFCLRLIEGRRPEKQPAVLRGVDGRKQAKVSLKREADLVRTSCSPCESRHVCRGKHHDRLRSVGCTAHQGSCV